MSTFGLDRNYEQFNFDQLSVDDLELVSGGSGGAMSSYLRAAKVGLAGAFSGTVAGALRGAAVGVVTGPGIVGMTVGGAAMGALVGFTGSALSSSVVG